jgi:hypothetical protein
MSRHRFPLLVALALLIAAAAQTAGSSPVYPGCASPAPVAGGSSHYVDPMHGSMSGDGSREHPWRTLQEVVADGLISTTPPRARKGFTGLFQGKPAGVIRPGDTVWLLSGDQGEVKLQGYFGKELEGYKNSEFITVAAAPGQTPVLRKLEILGGSRWAFRGLTFQSLNDTGQFAAGATTGKDYWLVALLGPHDNIVIDGDHFQSAGDVSRWTNDDWVRKRASGVVDEGGECVAITNNSLRNVGFGMQTQSSNKVLIDNNIINYFSDDGIDYGSSNLLITHNRITNSIEDGDGFHRDAMQGQPGKPYNAQAVAENIAIKDNVVIRLTDPALAHPGWLQGIDAFDGVWNNVEVSGNIVIVDAWHGISYYGVHGAHIFNNIVLGDGDRVLPCGSAATCAGKAAIVDRTAVPAIVIHSSKINQPSTKVVVENNITTGLRIDPKSPEVIVRNNLCLLTQGKCQVQMLMDGRMQWVGSPGVYGDHNVTADFDARALFTTYDTTRLAYDLKLIRRNPAVPR